MWELEYIEVLQQRAGRRNRILQRSQFWFRNGNCFFDCFLLLLFMIINNDLPQRTLPLCLTGNWRAFIQPVERWSDSAHLWTEKINYPFQRLSLPGDVFQDWRPFLLTHCLSLSILPFDFSSSLPLPLSLWLYKITWHPVSNKMVISETLVCHLLGQPAFQIKSYSLPQHLISQIHYLVVQQAELVWTR